MSLQELMRRAGVWRAGELPPADARATGFATLDQALPGGGWPRVGLTEILAPTAGIGALRLVLPALARVSEEGGWIVWVSPPHIPYPPALHEAGVNLSRVLIVDLPDRSPALHEDVLWACEQALRFADCSAALLWLDDVKPLHLRRLQLAAEAGATWGVVFRPAHHAVQPSPAVLRLGLDVPHEDDRAADAPDGRTRNALEVTLLKARGARPGARYRVET